VPTCRASRFLAIHHIVPRSEGGSHEPENLTLLCGGHHRALHEGKLTITGKAPDIVVTWAHAPRVMGLRASARTAAAISDSSSPPICESAPDREPPTTHVGCARDPRQVESTQLVADATEALVGLRFPKTTAHDAVMSAFHELGDDVTIARLCFEAIRRCKP